MRDSKASIEEKRGRGIGSGESAREPDNIGQKRRMSKLYHVFYLLGKKGGPSEKKTFSGGLLRGSESGLLLKPLPGGPKECRSPFQLPPSFATVKQQTPKRA